MPKLWDDTIEAHRRAVRDAILDNVAKLVAEHGLASVTMSQIAQETGIGRATLYKYFADVDEMLVAWHERQVASHMQQLHEACDGGGHSPKARLEAVLHAYAAINHDHHGGELAVGLHRREHVASAHQQLVQLLQKLIREGAAGGEFRSDVPASELAMYCLRALSASSDAPSQAAVRRLVTVTMAGLRAGGD
ncbi:MAG TPA: TetR/AcrR family transcriptional regulator [Polyangiales bacterium]|nr:TetR/AcrR family transcriptional regulator [Polyangiales bacterium]